MRLFLNMDEATNEIIRDLTKSPVMTSSRVQQLAITKEAHEAMNYAYSVQSVPAKASDLVAIGKKYFPFYRTYETQLIQWMEAEWEARMNAATGMFRDLKDADHLHPVLKDLYEGSELSYSYPERMAGMAVHMSNLLSAFPDSRRGYWPIFNELDGRRSSRLTRIPCSIGYDFAIRAVNGNGLKLHVTYLQRSADLEVFWLTDVWFASNLQYLLCQFINLDGWDPDSWVIKPGVLTHFILSLHMFKREEEIY